VNSAEWKLRLAGAEPRKMHEMLEDFEASEAALKAKDEEIDRLQEALDEYGVHHNGCAVFHRTREQIDRIEHPACTCGLEAALDSKEKKGEEKYYFYCKKCDRRIPEDNISGSTHYGFTEDDECLLCPGPVEERDG
jgi:hypothetical protein